MTHKEIDRLKVIHNVLQKKLTWPEAAEQLWLSERQIGRLVARVRQKGHSGIIHGLRGRPSNHQLEEGLLEKALSLVQAHYADFRPTFANEKIQKHGVHLSTFTLRQGMIKAGLWTPRKRKAKHRTWRARRSCVGLLIQLDGSPHDWFEGRGPRCVLLVFIDDATSRILYAEFIPEEDTVNLLRATKAYLLLHGRPVAFYVDKDSIYKINRQATVEEELRDEQPLTQFTRAMKELGIEVLCAHSPQAKGRVERGFKTHQDRLVKELRLAGISTIEAANRFLWSTYLPDHNARCAVEPANPKNAHRPLLKSHQLDQVLSLRTERILANDFTLRFHNRFFQLLKDQPVRLRPKDTVLVEVRLDGSSHLLAKGHYLNFKPIPKPPYQPFYATRKASKLPRKTAKPWTPPQNHPWKAFSYRKMLLKKQRLNNKTMTVLFNQNP
jgi:hypothetical protein